MSKQRQPAKRYPVWNYVEEELISWLAQRSGCATKALEAVRDGEPLSQDIADGLALAFGTSAGLWLGIDARYREWAAQKAEEVLANE